VTPPAPAPTGEAINPAVYGASAALEMHDAVDDGLV
jgi:hypothetical protein